MKGSTGAVKDIVHVKGSNLAICCGYDRFLRVFDYKTNEDLPQIYLKNKLNVVFPYDVKVESESDDEDNSEGDNKELEDEDLFEEGEDEEGDDYDEGEYNEEEDFEEEDDFEVIGEEDVDPIYSEEEKVKKSKKNSKKIKK